MIIKERPLTRKRRLTEEINQRQAEHYAKFVYMANLPIGTNIKRIVGRKVSKTVVLNDKRYLVETKISIIDAIRFQESPSKF